MVIVFRSIYSLASAIASWRQQPSEQSCPGATVVGKRLLLGALLLSLLIGCSRVQLLYRQLDWLLPMYLESYFGFDVEQQDFVDSEVAALLAWHCGSELEGYAALLRDLNSDVQRHELTRQQLWRYSAAIEDSWMRILAELTAPMTVLLRSVSDAQVAELKASFASNNAEAEQEFKDISAADLRAEQIERMEDRFEPWIGDLNHGQQRSLQWWADEFQAMGPSRLAMRQRWQQALLDALSLRHGPGFDAAIAKLFAEPRSLYTEAYRQQLEHNWQLSIEMIYRIAAQVDARQLQQLAATADAYAADFSELACAAPPG